MRSRLPICLWSGPRNVSTALMYSIAQLADVKVVDEPLYGHYLSKTAAPHPGANEIMQAMNCDGDTVIRNLLAEQKRRPEKRLFLKNMAHHLVQIDTGFLRHVDNVFLIRDPTEMLPSLINQIPQPTLNDTGLQRQFELFEELQAEGQKPLILDSRELLLDPPHVLRRLCEHLRLTFDADMLHWPKGPLAEDGVWAPHWYHAVHQSTGFQPYRKKQNFPVELKPLLQECQPWYDKLFASALRARPTGASY